MDKALEDIAKKHLGIATLETRGLDRLDFHDVSVWGVKSALKEAYQKGNDDLIESCDITLQLSFPLLLELFAAVTVVKLLIIDESNSLTMNDKRSKNLDELYSYVSSFFEDEDYRKYIESTKE